MLWWAAGLMGLVSLTPALDKAAPEPPRLTDGGFTISRAPDGQFYADVNVGAEHLRMLIDPGAATVLLTPQDAARLGVQPGDGSTNAVIPTLAIGPIGAAGVAYTVAPDLPVSLLGRSFLDQVSVHIDDERMVLR